MPITADPQEYSVSMKEIIVVKISGNLLILAQWRVKYINIKNAEAEKEQKKRKSGGKFQGPELEH